MNSIVQYLDITSNQEYLVDRIKGEFGSTATREKFNGKKQWTDYIFVRGYNGKDK